jgi:hypothetical protein
MILGLWGMWASRRHWREHSIFYAQFVAFAAVTAVFVGHTSYRAYLDVYWIVFAAGVLAEADLARWFRMKGVEITPEQIRQLCANIRLLIKSRPL